MTFHASSALRTALGLVLPVGMAGTGAELLLLGHTEDAWQLVPVVLLGLGILLTLWHLRSPGRTSHVLGLGLMALFVVSSAVGMWLHYSGNAEFELEMSPELGGWPLIREAMTGATPALAPGAMALIGLVGLVWFGVTSTVIPAANRKDSPQ